MEVGATSQKSPRLSLLRPVSHAEPWILVRVTHTGVVPMVLGSAQCLFTNATRFAFSYLVFGRLRAHPCVHVKSSLCAEQFQALQATCPLQREQTEPFPLAPGPRWALMEALVNYAARGPVVGPVRVRIIGDSMMRQTFWELVYLLRGESVFVDIHTFGPISYVQVVLTEQQANATASDPGSSRRTMSSSVAFTMDGHYGDLERRWEEITSMRNHSKTMALRVDYIPWTSYDPKASKAVRRFFEASLHGHQDLRKHNVYILGSPVFWPLVGDVARGFNSSELLSSIDVEQPLAGKVGTLWKTFVQASRNGTNPASMPFYVVLNMPTERVALRLKHEEWRTQHALSLNNELERVLGALNATDSQDWALVDFAALTQGRCPAAASLMPGQPVPGMSDGDWHYMCNTKQRDSWKIRKGTISILIREVQDCASTVNSALWRDLVLPTLHFMGTTTRQQGDMVSTKSACRHVAS